MKIKTILFIVCFAPLTVGLIANGQQIVSYGNSAKKFPGPQVYKDNDTGIIFYVESDGRHVVAISSEGKILWHRDPFVDAKLKPYRYDNPVIVQIGIPFAWMVKGRDEKYVPVKYNSTQCLILSIESGDPEWAGQD